MSADRAPRFDRPPIPVMLAQHHEGVAHLRDTRAVVERAPHVRLHQFERLDERLRAHLDGLRVAGPAGLDLARQGLASPRRGEVFAATVLALEHRDGPLLAQLLAVADTVPDAHDGVIAGLAWVSAPQLRGVIPPLLASTDPRRRALALTACALHQVPPGGALGLALSDVDAPLRATACRVAGQLGLVDLLPAVLRAVADPDPPVRFEAARAATRLGDRDAAPAALAALAFGTAGPWREPALATWLKVATPDDARAGLKVLAASPDTARLLLRAVGLGGDAFFVPWLLRQMAEPATARLAGEAFSTITGTDLAALDLDGDAPAGVEVGPDDDPAHADVAMDDDEGLPWPAVDRLTDWWAAHGPRFPAGTRLFCGAPPSPRHALDVLATGTQRHRRHAAEYLTLLQPGSPLFDATAPTWRQRRRLAAFTRPVEAAG